MATTASDLTPQQANAQGLSWVNRDHPLYGTAGFVGSTPNPGAPGGGPQPAAGAGTAASPTGSTATGTNPQAVGQQAQNAATYSTQPGAAPTQNTTNQGTQDVVRNSYLSQATQGTKVDTNDPNFRQQADPFAAAVERKERDFVSDQAEQAGPHATGALRGQARMAAESSGQAVGSFEADLVGRELQNRRAEIQQALASLGGMINSDQGRALQQELANLQAEIQRLGINTNADLTRSDQGLRERLAMLQDAYNNRALAQNQRQFSDTLGFNIGSTEAMLNQRSAETFLR